MTSGCSCDVVISQDDPRWAALAAALAGLVKETDATNAVVADSTENVWCRAVEMNAQEVIGLDALFALAMASASAPLAQGGRIRLVRVEESPYLFAFSFAAIYLLLLWFETPFETSRVDTLVRRRIREIERLTLALLPDDPESPAA